MEIISMGSVHTLDNGGRYKHTKPEWKMNLDEVTHGAWLVDTNRTKPERKINLDELTHCGGGAQVTTNTLRK